jgi:hypothetical protein
MTGNAFAMPAQNVPAFPGRVPSQDGAHAWNSSLRTCRKQLYYTLQNKVLRTIGNLPRCTLVRDMHVAFQIPGSIIVLNFQN